MSSPHGIDLLTLAASLPTSAWGKMAHALGWPTPRTVASNRGAMPRARWSDPYRNGYSGVAQDSDWLAAQALGLADGRAPTPVYRHHSWWVTPLGIRVVRLRLEAVRLAAKLRDEEVASV